MAIQKRKSNDGSRARKQSRAHCCCCGSDLALPARYLSLYLKLDTHLIQMSGYTVMQIDHHYLAQYCLLWHACGGTGRVKVDVTFEASPLPGHSAKVIAADRGPDDRLLLMADRPGRYCFSAHAVDSEGVEASDNLVFDLPVSPFL